ncbi:hypothetical protein GEMRC1_000427 [Eukaryota sp. GEM-RC1]
MKLPRDVLTALCKCLLINTTVIDFRIKINQISLEEATSLAEVIRSKTTLKKLLLTCHNEKSLDDQFRVLFSAISSHSLIEELDISGLRVHDSIILLPLSESSSLRTVLFPSIYEHNTPLHDALKCNSNIRKVAIYSQTAAGEDLGDVLPFLFV